jgi:hypothetical protein
MRKKIITLLLAVLTLTLSTCHPAYAQRPTWQSAIEPAIRLSVRDTSGNATRHTYAATFAVTSPSGGHYYKTVQVTGDEYGAAVFPRDFEGASGEWRGRFTYTCAVDGAIIYRGTFTFQSTFTFSPQSNRRLRRQR